MNVCINCLSVEDRNAAFCANCGHEEFGKLNSKGFLVAIPHEAGMPCQGCFSHGRDLKFRYYRYAMALIFWAQIGYSAGYFCRSCRWKQFGKHFSISLFLGWWNFWFLFFRNPATLAVTTWALFAAPFNAASLGAIDLDDIKLAEQEEEELTDLYASMPSWLDQLEEHEIDLVVTNVDYYEVLGVQRSAPTGEIKSAWRNAVKAHHPDSAGPDCSPELMPLINDANTVLCEDRLRYAYDHQSELLTPNVDGERGFDFDSEPDEDLTGYDFGCQVCQGAFTSAGSLSDHVSTTHPGVKYSRAFIKLKDGIPVDVGHAGRQEWKCKACEEHFENYVEALRHADEDHPERLVVDPRSAVEKV